MTLRRFFAAILLAALVAASVALPGCGDKFPADLVLMDVNIDFGQDASELTFALRNSGDDLLAWRASTTATWIVSITPDSGILGGDETAVVMVVITRDGLAPGEHAGSIRLTGNGDSAAQDLAVVCSVECGLPPRSACRPSPAHTSRDVPLATELEWGCGTSPCSLPVSFEVYYGPDPSPPLAGTTTVPRWDPTLELDTTYYWQIVTIDANGRTPGPVWFFTTETGCTDPPTEPCTPTPANGEVGVLLAASLGWDCGESLCKLPVTYDVYLGTTASPPLVGNTVEPTWNPSLALGTTYFWKIVAKDANGETEGPVWSFTTDAGCTAAPTVPCAPSPSDASPNVGLDSLLRWNCGDSPCDLPVTYDVHFGTSPSPPFVATTNARVWNPSLDLDTTYYWKVVARDANGSTEGAVWSFTTEAGCTDPPTAPCAPSPTNGSTNVPVNRILAWSCGDSVCELPVTYDVHFGTSPSPPFVASTTGRTWAPPVLDLDTTYYWKVVAKDANGDTEGPEWSFTTTTGCTDPPTVPCAPVPSDGAPNVPLDFTLSWSCGQSVCELPVGYDVHFGTSPSPPFVETTGVTSWSPPALELDTTYYWKIVAKDANGSSPGSVWSFTTEAGCVDAPTAPCTPAPTNAGTDVPVATSLTWGCGESQCGLTVTYDVYVGTAADPPRVGSTSAKSWTPANPLSLDTTYFWRIVAKDANGETSSAVWSFTTEAGCVDPPTVPCTPAPANAGSDVPVATSLTWGCGSSRCGLTVDYEVYLGTAADPPLVGSTSAKSWTPASPLDFDTTYFWRVVAKDANGDTSSPVWSFATIGDPTCTITVSGPAEDVVWRVGDVQSIKWESINAGPTVILALYRAGSFVCDLGSVANTGSLDWTVDDCGEGTADDYSIRVAADLGAACFGFSASFTIQTEAVTAPTSPAGPAGGNVGESHAFTTGGAASNFSHPVEYRFDWDDGTLSPWGAPSASHAWSDPGTYGVRARARCSLHPQVVSPWSGRSSIAIADADLTIVSAQLLLLGAAGQTPLGPFEAHWNADPWEEPVEGIGDCGGPASTLCSTFNGGWSILSFNVVDCVRAWVEGSRPNHGFSIRPAGDPTQRWSASYHSSEATSPGSRPSLTVRYDRGGVESTVVLRPAEDISFEGCAQGSSFSCTDQLTLDVGYWANCPAEDARKERRAKLRFDLDPSVFPTAEE